MTRLLIRVSTVCGTVAMLCTFGCEPASLVEVDPPGTVVDPGVVSTPAGALQLHAAATTAFAMAFGGAITGNNYVMASGTFGDELSGRSGEAEIMDWRDQLGVLGVNNQAGTRQRTYYALQIARVRAQQGREALSLYAPDVSKALQGQMASLEAHAILWFAEGYCNGIPLSSAPLTGAADISPGFTTAELFERAAALFDTAATLSADSARLVNLARVGKGRALVGLGKLADAATAVRDVPTDFVYTVNFSATLANLRNQLGLLPMIVKVLDAEGTNGLTWSSDPRAGITTAPSLTSAMPVPGKYMYTGGVLNPTLAAPQNPIRLSDGLEARLIEAEAALFANNPSWLTILNTLRSTCVGSAACAPVPGLAANSLPPLTDPGTATGRVDMVMRERAMWLYLTGHRFGDLRRLVRLYNRAPESVYPTGIMSHPAYAPLVPQGSGNGRAFGPDYVMLPDQAETVNNPKYTGCVDTAP